MGLAPVFCCLWTDGLLKGDGGRGNICGSPRDSNGSDWILPTRTQHALPLGEREKESGNFFLHQPGGYCATGRGGLTGEWATGLRVYFAAWTLKTRRFWRALGTASMAGSASEVIFISVNHSITLMGELTSLTKLCHMCAAMYFPFSCRCVNLKG